MHRAIGTGLAGVGVTIISTFAPSLGLSLHQQRIGFAIGVLLMLAGIGIFAASYLAGRGKRQGSAIGTLDPRYEALSDLLGRSITVGLQLSGEEGEDWPLRDAWEAHTRLLVESAYGSGEGAHVFTPDLSEPRVFVGLDISNAPRPLAAPIERLRELLGRMPSLTMRLTFRPEGWEAFDQDTYRAEQVLRIKEIDGSTLCPWCGKKIGEHASSCDACGAERGGDFLYRKSSDEPPAYARLLRLPPVDDMAVLADLFKEGDDLRSACTRAPDGNLAQKAHSSAERPRSNAPARIRRGAGTDESPSSFGPKRVLSALALAGSPQERQLGRPPTIPLKR